MELTGILQLKVRRNIIRRRFFYSYSQNFWATEISSYTAYTTTPPTHTHNVFTIRGKPLMFWCWVSSRPLVPSWIYERPMGLADYTTACHSFYWVWVVPVWRALQERVVRGVWGCEECAMCEGREPRNVWWQHYELCVCVSVCVCVVCVCVCV